VLPPKAHVRHERIDTPQEDPISQIAAGLDDEDAFSGSFKPDEIWELTVIRDDNSIMIKATYELHDHNVMKFELVENSTTVPDDKARIIALNLSARGVGEWDVDWEQVVNGNYD